jgi:hypothetical protein
MIEIICDAEGCDTRGTLKGHNSISPMLEIPAGWCQVIGTVDELEAKRRQDRDTKAASRMAFPAMVSPSEIMGLGRMRSAYKKVLCPKHPLPKFKVVVEDDNDLDVFAG